MQPATPSTTRILPLRRLALLATTVVGIAAGGLIANSTLTPYAPLARAQNLSQEAQSVARPIGFADIVEKVKPAVISVRVKMRTTEAPQAQSGDESPFPKDSPMDKFFRRFGTPEGGPAVPR